MQAAANFAVVATLALLFAASAFAGTETVPAPQPAVRKKPIVWAPGVVKAYPVNRYIDPANRRIMHERHVLYRRESDGGWILDVPPDQQAIVGPVVATGERNRPALLRKELASELARQKQASAQLEAEAKKVADRQEEMTRHLVEFTQTVRGSQGNLVRVNEMGASITELRRQVEALTRANAEMARRLEEVGRREPTPAPSPAQKK